MVIESREATVLTVSVTIKAIIVGQKQMTLSMFRQLPVHPIFTLDETAGYWVGRLQGEPWGIVNYFWGKCSPRDHFHVVWVFGGILSRACVSPLELESVEDRTDEVLLYGFRRRMTEQSHNDLIGLYKELQNLPQLFIAV